MVTKLFVLVLLNIVNVLQPNLTVRICPRNNLLFYISTKQKKNKSILKDNSLVNVPMLLLFVGIVIVVVLHRTSKLLDPYDVNIVDNQWVILYQQS